MGWCEFGWLAPLHVYTSVHIRIVLMPVHTYVCTSLCIHGMPTYIQTPVLVYTYWTYVHMSYVQNIWCCIYLEHRYIYYTHCIPVRRVTWRRIPRDKEVVRKTLSFTLQMGGRKLRIG